MITRPPDSELIHMYRNVFGSPEGHIVLQDILSRLYYGDQLDNDAERLANNCAVTILSCCGFLPGMLSAKSVMNDSANWMDYFKENV